MTRPFAGERAGGDEQLTVRLVNRLERLALSVRRSRFLEGADALWSLLRPGYSLLVSVLGRRGLDRTINGIDRMRILPRFRAMSETYEPEVWNHLMSEVRPGDTVADVGAFIGLYTVALAKRVGDTGRVFAFEPDPHNWPLLSAHVRLNGVEGRVELVQAVVGACEEELQFLSGRGSESRVADGEAGAVPVPCRRLDSIFGDRRLDILKVDVEGYEEHVLRGAEKLLADPDRSPRGVYLEVHPYAWAPLGTSSESLLEVLRKHRYVVSTLSGEPVSQIAAYGQILARKV